MKILVRLLCPPDTIAALAEDALLRDACDLGAVVVELDADGAVFERVLARTTGAAGCWLNPRVEFTRAELDSCRYFQLEGRKLLRESARDYEINAARLESLPFHATGPFRIRLLDRFALSQAPLEPNEVACAGDWSAEFVVSTGVWRRFEAEDLTGADLRPVVSGTTGAVHEHMGLLHTTHVLPLATLDETTPRFPDPGDGGGYRQLACLTYAFRKGEPGESDFFRTAENWSSNYLPVWVVSARVRKVWARHALRGWAFRPVLEEGTALHAAYRARWESLMSRTAASNPGHHF